MSDSKRKFIHPGQSIGLSLTAEERTLLAENILVLDTAYATRIRDAPANKRQVPFTLDELDDLAGYVAAEANHCESKRKQKVLDGIHSRVQRLLETHTDDEETARADASAVVAAAGIDPEVFNPLRMFMAEMEAMGVDVEAALENMKPKKVGPEDKIPVRMSAAEKELVLGLVGLSEAIKARIGQTRPKKRTVELTLREVTELEHVMTPLARGCADRKLTRKWRAIINNLTDVQSQHTDGTEPEDGLQRLLDGQPVSRGAVVRDMLLKFLEERKGKR
jgi:hypothetical protein